MPNRILRDWTDSLTIAKLSPEAERFFIRLIMKADDFGRFHGDERLLKAALFPLLTDVRLAEVRQWRDECVTADLTALYQDGRERKFLEIKGFNQRTRAKESKFPPPDKRVTVTRPSHDRHMRTETETETETEPQTGKAAAVSGSIRGQPFPESIDTPTFRQAWTEWIDYLVDKTGTAPTFHTSDKQLAELAAMGEIDAIKAIDNAIAVGLRKPCLPYNKPKNEYKNNPKSNNRTAGTLNEGADFSSNPEIVFRDDELAIVPD